MPAPLGAFVGRDAELRALASMLQGTHTPILIVGPPGVGKSRLALEASLLHKERSWLAPLHDTHTSSDLLRALATSFELASPTLEQQSDPSNWLLSRLQPQPPGLLILDHIEHLNPDAIALLTDLLSQLPHLRSVWTSQHTGSCDPERTLRLSPLSPSSARALLDARAFARGVSRLLEQTPNAHITALLEELDHLPLAIELATGRLGTLSVQDLRASLHTHTRVLENANAELQDPHRSMESAISWAFDALPLPQQTLLLELQAFTDGADLEALEAVLEPTDDLPVLAHIEVLVSCSMVHTQGTDGIPRFSLLRSIASHLKRRPAPNQHTNLKHAAHYTRAAAQRLQALWSHDVLDALAWLQRERHNLTAVVERHLTSHPELAARAALGLDDRPFGFAPDLPLAHLRTLHATPLPPFLRAQIGLSLGRALYVKGELESSLHVLQSARIDLDAASAQTPPPPWLLEMEGLLHVAHAHTLHLLGLPGLTQHAIDAAESTLPILTNPFVHTFILEHVGMTHTLHGRHARAQACLLQALGAVSNPSTHPPLRSAILKRLGAQALFWGRPHTAREYLVDAQRVALDADLPYQHARHLNWMSRIEMDLGAPAKTIEYATQALAQHRAQGDLIYACEDLYCLGCAHFYMGQPGRGQRLLEESRALAKQAGSIQHIAGSCVILALIAFDAGQLQRAISLMLEIQDPDASPFFLGVFIILRCFEGRLDQARALLPRLERLRQNDQDPWSPLIEVTLLCLDLHIARLEPSRHPEPHALQERASRETARLEREDVTLTEERILRGYLETSLAHLEHARRGATPRDALRHDPEGRWFEAPNGTYMGLERRGALRRIFSALLTQRAQRPGEPLDVWEIFAAGWPEVRATPRSSAQRVYTAIWQLRKGGLEGLLIQGEDGYLLRHDVDIHAVKEL